MSQSGLIHNIQTSTLKTWSESKCVKSSLTFFEKAEENTPVSIKLVTKGTERYRLNSSTYKLKQGEFIIVGQGQSLETSINSKELTNGICIYPPLSLMQEVFAGFCMPLEKQMNTKVESTSFYLTTNSYRLHSPGCTSSFLAQHIPALLNKDEKNEDWWQTFYLKLAEHLAYDQQKVNHILSQLEVAKKHTKEELYRRISKTKDFIHDNKFENIDLDELAKLSSLSKYHFLRSFKSIYKKSPYQYLLNLKLTAAKKLLQEGYTYQEIAHKIGYSDAKNLRKKLKNSL